MELLEIQHSYIKLRVDNRTAKIEGEGFSRQLIQPGQDASKYVDYVVYADTLIWDKPHASEPLTAAERASILDFLKQDFSQRNQLLAVE